MINVFGRPIGAPSHLTRLVLLSALSVALMMLDHRGHHLEKIRAGLNVLAYPIQIIASAPAYIGRGIADFFTTRRPPGGRKRRGGGPAGGRRCPGPGVDPPCSNKARRCARCWSVPRW